MGDSGKARRVLGWQPTITFDDLVKLMVDHDLELANEEAASRARKSKVGGNKARWGTL